MQAFSAVVRNLNSPTLWIEIADSSDLTDDAAAELTASEILSRSDVRVLSRDDAFEADRVWFEEEE
jgi:hypothetical protein